MEKSTERTNKGHDALIKSIDDIKLLLASDMKKICEGTGWIAEDQKQVDGSVTEDKKCNLVLLSPQFPDKVYSRLIKLLGEPDSKSVTGIIPEKLKEKSEETGNTFEEISKKIQAKINGTAK